MLLSSISIIIIINLLSKDQSDLKGLNNDELRLNRMESVKLELSNSISQLFLISEILEDNSKINFDYKKSKIILGVFRNNTLPTYVLGPNKPVCSGSLLRVIFQPFFGLQITRGDKTMVSNLSSIFEADELLNGCIKVCVNKYGSSNPIMGRPIVVLSCLNFSMTLVTNYDEQRMVASISKLTTRLRSYEIIITSILSIIVFLLVVELIIMWETKRRYKRLSKIGVFPKSPRGIRFDGDHSPNSSKFGSKGVKKEERNSICLINTKLMNNVIDPEILK